MVQSANSSIRDSAFGEWSSAQLVKSDEPDVAESSNRALFTGGSLPFKWEDHDGVVFGLAVLLLVGATGF